MVWPWGSVVSSMITSVEQGLVQCLFLQRHYPEHPGVIDSHAICAERHTGPHVKLEVTPGDAQEPYLVSGFEPGLTEYQQVPYPCIFSVVSEPFSLLLLEKLQGNRQGEGFYMIPMWNLCQEPRIPGCFDSGAQAVFWDEPWQGSHLARPQEWEESRDQMGHLDPRAVTSHPVPAKNPENWLGLMGVRRREWAKQSLGNFPVGCGLQISFSDLPTLFLYMHCTLHPLQSSPLVSLQSLVIRIFSDPTFFPRLACGKNIHGKR